MFGAWYWSMVIICVSVTFYVGVWAKEHGIESKKKYNLVGKLARIMFYFVPIINTALAILYTFLFVGTLVWEKELLHALREESKKEDKEVEKND